MAQVDFIQRSQREQQQEDESYRQGHSQETTLDETEEQDHQNTRDGNIETTDEFPESFLSKKLYRVAVKILLWENPLWTAASFVFLQCLFYLIESKTLTSSIAYLGLIFLIPSAIIKMSGYQFEQGHPIHTVMHSEVFISEREIVVLTNGLAKFVNNAIVELRSLFLWEYMIPSFKLLLSLGFLCVIGPWLTMRMMLLKAFTAGLFMKAFKMFNKRDDIQLPTPVSGNTILKEHRHIIEIKNIKDQNAVEIVPIKSFKQYTEAVMKEDRLVVVCCVASWCSACKAAMPRVTKLVSNYQKMVTFYTIDMDLNHECSQTLGVSALPTFLLYKGGQELHRIVGDVDTLEENIGAWLSHIE